MSVDYSKVPSPCYLLEEKLLRKNLEQLAKVQKAADVSIILAFKGFSMWSVFPMIKKYLKGATASSLWEAQLCKEKIGRKAHTYAPAYIPEEFEKIMNLSSHITFNSIAQYELYKTQISNHKKPVSCGIRVNPEISQVGIDLYNPCMSGSRLGEISSKFNNTLPEGIEGLHFHVLCESSAKDLENALAAFEKKFGQFIPQLKWVNMGGGHLITRKGYDRKHLVRILKKFKKKYPNLKIILEPGSAVAWQTGNLVSTVLDIFESGGIQTAILDVSFTAHMPDTLEMPYRPKIKNATDPIKGKPTYRIGGMSCLSGDFMTEYSFKKKLKIGDRIIFEDMMHYTMVKTTMFNGVKHPDIGIWTEKNKYKSVRKFSYEDFKNRLS